MLKVYRRRTHSDDKASLDQMNHPLKKLIKKWIKITSVAENHIKSKDHSGILDFYILTNQFLVFLQISRFAYFQNQLRPPRWGLLKCCWIQSHPKNVFGGKCQLQQNYKWLRYKQALTVLFLACYDFFLLFYTLKTIIIFIACHLPVILFLSRDF